MFKYELHIEVCKAIIKAVKKRKPISLAKDKHTHGGKREGAGRKPVYNEPLQRVYVPLSMVEEIKTMIRDRYMTK